MVFLMGTQLLLEFLHGNITLKGRIISYWNDSVLHFTTQDFI